MKKLLAVSLLFLLVACTQYEEGGGLIGTWEYEAEKAPFGFQSGRVIFFEENEATRAIIKIYGLTIATKNLQVEGDHVSFIAQVEHEEISIKLEMVGKQLTGTAQGSDLTTPLVMIKKGRQVERPDPPAQDQKKQSEQVAASDAPVINKLAAGASADGAVNYRVHTFYYGWYGNPEVDDAYRGWNHRIIPHWVDTQWNDAGSYPGGDDVGANFYPQLGSYSSNNPDTIDTHMRQIRDAGIGVLSVSWWGESHFTDTPIQLILDTAHKYELKVSFHIEPFYNTVEEFKSQLAYLAESYLQHPAIYKYQGKPFYYLYNSFQLKHDQWNTMLNPQSDTSIRNTALDGIFISLWTTQFDGQFAVESGFDGVYTYFASDGFSYGSTTANWPQLSQFARDNALIYIPSIGPGYIDTRIRPWNEKTTKARDSGVYYEAMFDKAVNTSPDFLSITSFNEWHEGTQIEPVIPKELPGYTYEDYGEDADPLIYIRKTKELVNGLRLIN